jgi:hypothetical protein
MRQQSNPLRSATAVLVLAEIKAAIEAFDRGDTNVSDAFDVIIIAVESYQAAASAELRHNAA